MYKLMFDIAVKAPQNSGAHLSCFSSRTQLGKSGGYRVDLLRGLNQFEPSENGSYPG